MKKNLLVSAVASLALAGSLHAVTGPGTSVITVGSDANGTVHSNKLQAAPIDLNASASLTNDAAAVNFISYVPNIAVGQGNLITIKVNNGSISSNINNELWLTDANSTDSNGSGALAIAAMTDFKKDGTGGYNQLTFKFQSKADSNSNLILANSFETNATLEATYGIGSGVALRTTGIALRVNQGLDCAENVTLEVINSKDQSGSDFNVPNTAGKSETGVTVVKGVFITLGSGGKNTSTTDLDNGNNGVANSGTATFKTGFCPTYSCTISIKDEEKAFGSSIAGSSSICPTCTEVTSTQDLTCEGSFLLGYVTNLLQPGKTQVDVNAVNLTTTTALAGTMAELSSISAKLSLAADYQKMTISGQTASINLSTPAPVKNAANPVFVEYKANGTSLLTPNSFDITAKVNGNTDVDTIVGFMKFNEDGQQLDVAYMNANPAYRTFMRVGSTSTTTIQAIITANDGTVSTRFDVSKAGVPLSLGANGGALVVEAADVLASAQAAGYTGAGFQFNATFFVKSAGTIDAVAFQKDADTNSQRYLPVRGATGGVKGR